MKKMIYAAMLCMAAALASACPALAQTTTQTFSAYVQGLLAVNSVIGTEKIVVLQGGVPKTLTPYQILSAVSGDCSIASPPSIVCTKTNGVAFAPSATTDTTNAGNIGSGTLSLLRLSLPQAQLYVGNASGNPAGVAMSGDCTMTSAGGITCPKVNGATFATSATTDTTNAGNISTGTLAGARMSAVNLAAGNTNGGVSGQLPLANGGCSGTSAATCFANVAPTPTRAGDLIYWNGSTWVTIPGNVTAGTQVLSENGSGVPSWVAVGAGSVTNFSAGNLSPLFTASVSNPASTPALSFAPVPQSANQLYAGPASGAAAAPAFRALQACGDFPSGTLVHHAASYLTTAATDSNANAPSQSAAMTSSQGTQYTQAGFTPCASTNLCVARATGQLSVNVTAGNANVAIFQDAGATAIGQINYNLVMVGGVANLMATPSDVIYSGNCGTTSATLFKLRFGFDRAGTITYNGVSSATANGGVARAGIEVWEYVP